MSMVLPLMTGMVGHYGIEVWCEGIDVLDTSVPKLVHIPDVGEARVTLEVCHLDTHLYVEPMDRAQVGTPICTLASNIT